MDVAVADELSAGGGFTLDRDYVLEVAQVVRVITTCKISSEVERPFHLEVVIDSSTSVRSWFQAS